MGKEKADAVRKLFSDHGFLADVRENKGYSVLVCLSVALSLYVVIDIDRVCYFYIKYFM